MNMSSCARWALAFALFSSGCPGPEGATLTITDPTTGSTLGAADDTNPATAGVQIDVTASSDNLSSGASVDLLVDGASAASAVVDAAGGLLWEGVSLANGTHTLVAVTREGGIRSDDVVVVVNDACFSITFVEPEVAGDAVRLTSADDTDGEACGATFETSVVVATSAPDGSEAQIFVNSTPRASTTVTGGVARFTGVALDNRGPTSANTIRVAVTDAAGLGCAADYPLPVYVECEGPSCAISQPGTGTAFLSSDDDTSAADGFQTDFEVTTDSGVQGRLIIDGDVDGAMSASFTGGTATFGNVSLTEALHRVVAECTDSLGNTTRSGAAEWTVDITGCGVTVESPTEGQLIVVEDDVDPATPGVQIAVGGTAGSDCTGLRVGLCSGIDAMSFGAVAASWSEEATLATTAMQELCAQTSDEAGNVSEARVGLRFGSDFPALEIAAPSADARFNQATDLTPGDTTCAQDAEVYCDRVGQTVELYRADTATLVASATCEADATVPSPYTGRASFDAVALPNQEDGTAFPLEARMTIDRVVGMSAPVLLYSDCNAPSLSITRPVCGATLSAATQDEDASTPGFQYRTAVGRGDTRAPVTLSIGPAGGTPIFTATDSSVGASSSFMASYSAGGLLEITATATDGAGNLGRSGACAVTVTDLPSLVITSPTEGDVLGAAEDCSTDPGMQVNVLGTSDAPRGSTVVVRVGTAMITDRVRARGIDVCIDAAEGPNTLTVEVTDARGTASATIDFGVDTMGPSGTIDPVAAMVLDRRAGTVRFQWTALDDGGAPLASYELRCAASPITDEAGWTAARVLPITTVPGTAGTMESEDVAGFHTGDDVSCVLRGADAAGGLTGIGPNVSVSLPFLTHVVDGVGTTGFANEVFAVGDLNGDMIADVLTGGTGTAYLWYGSTGALPTAPAVTFRSSHASFGAEAIGLGDFNGDGLDDFAIAAPNAESNQGRILVFFGRATAWPASCDTDLPTCAPDILLTRPAGSAAFGSTLSTADFDGDGVFDLLAGAPAVSGFRGEVYVVRGGSHLVSGTSFVVSAGHAMAPRGFVITPPAASVAAMGIGLAGMGSIDADARSEIVIGAPGSAGGNASLLLVQGQDYTGSGIQMVPASAVTIFATDIVGRYGVVVAAGDANGDSFPDLQAYGPVGASAGRVEVYLGTGSGFAATSLFLVTNDAPGNRDGDTFGGFIATSRHGAFGNLGDLDRDTINDLSVGSREFGDDPNGSIELFYGATPAVDRARSEATPSLRGTDGLRRPGFVGDVNGDGWNDIGVGEPAANSAAGRLTILY